jgi:tRNA (guanine-N7-)-methyltransferase
MSASRERALAEILPKFEISSLPKPIDLSFLSRNGKTVVDFGCGMGDHSLALATNNPDVGIISIDVHTVGLLAIVEAATEQNLTNIATHHGDGIAVFKEWLKPESIDELHILFPDPWPKARHHKRRLITEFFLNLAFPLLKADGRIIFVTDDVSYFESAKQTFIDCGKFELTFGNWDVPLTTYHRRAIRLGHKISQLSARKS